MRVGATRIAVPIASRRARETGWEAMVAVTFLLGSGTGGAEPVTFYSAERKRWTYLVSLEGRTSKARAAHNPRGVQGAPAHGDRCAGRHDDGREDRGYAVQCEEGEAA